MNNLNKNLCGRVSDWKNVRVKFVQLRAQTENIKVNYMHGLLFDHLIRNHLMIYVKQINAHIKTSFVCIYAHKCETHAHF